MKESKQKPWSEMIRQEPLDFPAGRGDFQFPSSLQELKTLPKSQFHILDCDKLRRAPGTVIGEFGCCGEETPSAREMRSQPLAANANSPERIAARSTPIKAFLIKQVHTFCDGPQVQRRRCGRSWRAVPVSSIHASIEIARCRGYNCGEANNGSISVKEGFNENALSPRAFQYFGKRATPGTCRSHPCLS